jgi:hypothetical protein
VALVEHILVPPVLVVIRVGLLHPDWVMVLPVHKPLALVAPVALVLVGLATTALRRQAVLAA